MRLTKEDYKIADRNGIDRKTYTWEWMFMDGINKELSLQKH